MNEKRAMIALAVGIALCTEPVWAEGAPAPAPSSAELAQRIGMIADQDAIERLHDIYGYQQDYMLYYAQADLTARKSEHHYKYGIYRDLDGARRLWPGRWGGFTNFSDMPVFGALIDHHQSQGIITIAPDRRTAKARFRTSADRFYSRGGQGLAHASQAAEGAEHSVWYENDYVREDGIWKISGVRVCIYAEGAVGSGFADLPVAGRFGIPADAGPDYWKTRVRTEDDPGDWNVLYPKRANGPDAVETPQEFGCYFAKNQTMIHSVVLPFSFANPVTGKAVQWQNK